MRNNLSLAAAALGALVLVGACSDSRQVTPLAPTDPSLAKSAECSGSLAAKISKDVKALYPDDPAQAEALTLFGDVKDNCPNTDDMLAYVQFTIDQLSTPRPDPAGTFEQNLLAHWNDLFHYVGYVSAADIPSSPGVLALTGGAGVLDLDTLPSPEGAVVLTYDDGAGVRVYPQTSLTGSRLFTIEKTGGTCFVTNLEPFGGCYTFGIYPHTVGFDPKLVFAICTPGEIPSTALLGHQPESGPFVVLEHVNIHVCPGTGGTLTWLRNRGALGRFVASALDLFLPQPLYATHGGLSGEDDSASPVGGVNVQTFFADFNNDNVGSAPDTPEVGTWSANSAPPPGTILVQNSIGDLTDQPVVLSQAGGACSHCGTLALQGTMTNSGNALANTGVYEVHWSSLEDKPTVKDAPLVLRDHSGRELARLSYATVSSEDVLYYNGMATGCTWTQSVAQNFVITVDFGTKKTSLSIEGCSTQISDSTEDVGFVKKAATDLASVGWELSGIDAGIIGWDNVVILRLADN